MILIWSCSCPCAIHWSQVLSREWRCSWSSAGRRCSDYIWVINNFIAYYDATYIRGLMVIEFCLWGIPTDRKDSHTIFTLMILIWTHQVLQEGARFSWKFWIVFCWKWHHVKLINSWNYCSKNILIYIMIYHIMYYIYKLYMYQRHGGAYLRYHYQYHCISHIHIQETKIENTSVNS